MIVVVDAYNLLKRGSRTIEISYQDRVRFIAWLTAYQKQKGHSIVVVFDGGDALWPTVHQQRHVSVVYSGVNRSADDYIKQYIAQHAHQELLLVSSDGELVNWADRYDVVSIAPEDFIAVVGSLDQGVRRQRSAQSVAIKIHKEGDADFDAYMQEAAQNVLQKAEDNAVKSRIKVEGAVSGKEKKMLRLLKKL